MSGHGRRVAPGRVVRRVGVPSSSGAKRHGIHSFIHTSSCCPSFDQLSKLPHIKSICLPITTIRGEIAIAPKIILLLHSAVSPTRKSRRSSIQSSRSPPPLPTSTTPTTPANNVYSARVILRNASDCIA